MIITSFVRVIYPLKYPSNACLSCLDNGPCCWNAIILRVSKHHTVWRKTLAKWQGKNIIGRMRMKV